MKFGICSGDRLEGCTAQQDIERLRDRAVGADLDDLVLFLDFVDQQLVRAGRHPLHVERTEHLGVVVKHADFLPLLLGYRGDRSSSSYSTGTPRSKNGTTTLFSPDVKATPRKISSL